MTKKKTSTPTPTKKAAPKKTENKPTWKQTGEAHIPGLGTIKEFDVKFTQDTSPSAQDIADALQAENQALRSLLSKQKQSEDMPTGNKVATPQLSMLDQFHREMDHQLSRQYNAINSLCVISDRLHSTMEEVNHVSGPQPEPNDLSTKLSNLLGYASYQNDRFEMLVEKLSKLI